MTCSAGRSLDQGQTESFGQAHHHDRVRIAIQLPQLFIAHVARIDRSGRPFQVVLPEHGTAPADDNQWMSATFVNAKTAVRLRQSSQILAGIHAANREKVAVGPQLSLRNAPSSVPSQSVKVALGALGATTMGPWYSEATWSAVGWLTATTAAARRICARSSGACVR